MTSCLLFLALLATVYAQESNLEDSVRDKLVADLQFDDLDPRTLSEINKIPGFPGIDALRADLASIVKTGNLQGFGGFGVPSNNNLNLESAGVDAVPLPFEETITPFNAPVDSSVGVNVGGGAPQQLLDYGSSAIGGLPQTQQLPYQQYQSLPYSQGAHALQYGQTNYGLQQQQQIQQQQQSFANANYEKTYERRLRRLSGRQQRALVRLGRINNQLVTTHTAIGTHFGSPGGYPGGAQGHPGFAAQAYPIASAGQVYPGDSAGQIYPVPSGGQIYPGDSAGQIYPGDSGQVYPAGLPLGLQNYPIGAGGQGQHIFSGQPGGDYGAYPLNVGGLPEGINYNGAGFPSGTGLSEGLQPIEEGSLGPFEHHELPGLPEDLNLNNGEVDSFPSDIESEFDESLQPAVDNAIDDNNIEEQLSDVLVDAQKDELLGENNELGARDEPRENLIGEKKAAKGGLLRSLLRERLSKARGGRRSGRKSRKN